MTNPQKNMLLAFLLIILPVHVQFVSADSSDAVKQISSLMKSAESVQGKFVQQKKLAGFSRPIKSSGFFFLQKSQTLEWQINSPMESRLVIDLKDKRYFSDTQNPDSNAEKPATYKLVGEIVVALFEGDWATLENYFTLDGEIEEDQTWTASLVPKSEALARAINKIILSGDQYVKSVVILETSEDETHIEFSDIQPRITEPAQ